MLQFCNHTNRPISVCILRFTPNCDGNQGNFTKEGWWNLDPNQCAVTFGGSCEDLNRFFGYFAVDADGRVWAGDIVRGVPNRAFSMCEFTGASDTQDVGFRLLDVDDNDNVTVNLVA